MEGLAAVVGGLILLLILATDSNKKNNSRFEILETADPNYFKVWDYETNSDAFVGTRAQCEDYISRH